MELLYTSDYVTEPPPGHEHAAPRSIMYSGRLDLFNGKEIPVGLRDIAIVFVCAGGEVRNESLDLGVVNLPPRQWVSKEMRSSFNTRVESNGWTATTAASERSREDMRLLSRWYRVEFVGQRQRRGLFEPKTFRKTIASRPPFPNPFR